MTKGKGKGKGKNKMYNRQEFKKIADEVNFVNKDGILNKILEGARTSAKQGSYSIYIDSFFTECDYSLKIEILNMLESPPYNFEIEKISDIRENSSSTTLYWK